MNTLQTYFLIIGVLAGIGLPFLMYGVVLPSAVEWGYMDTSLEYVILDQDSEPLWAVIPGIKGIGDIKKFYIYECSNPEDVALRGATPQMVEVGPFTYKFTSKYTVKNYITEGSVKGNKVNFTHEFNHEYVTGSGGPPLTDEHRVLNVAGLKRWKSVKTRPRFHIAIESFYELFRHAVDNIEKDMIIKDLVKYYSDSDNVDSLVSGLSIDSTVRKQFYSNNYYGLKQEYNVHDWTSLCEGSGRFLEHEITNFFGVDNSQFSTIKERFCKIYNERISSIHTGFCRNIPHCSRYNITLQQWMYGTKLYPHESYANISYKRIFGYFEFNLFKAHFLEIIKPEYKEQFENVEFDPNDHYEYLLYTEYSYPDFVTDPASVLVYDNMRRLFVAGDYTESPYKEDGVRYDEDAPKTEIELMRFDYIRKLLRLKTNAHAYLLYAYFSNFIDYTVIMKQHGGTFEMERITNYGAVALKEISLYYLDYLDVVTYARAMEARNAHRSCDETVRYYFLTSETQDLIQELSEALCYNWWFNTELPSGPGWKCFIESVAHYKRSLYLKLLDYLTYYIGPQFTEKMLESMVYDTSGKFWKELDDIKKKVKSHYSSICNGYGNHCTKKQLFVAQFYDSAVTRNPYSESNLNPTKYVSDWWRIIEDYEDELIVDPTSQKSKGPGRQRQPRKTANNSKATEGTSTVLYVELEIEVPIEFDFLKANFGSTTITKDDIYATFFDTGLYDPDLLYYIRLNEKRQNKDLDNKYLPFATQFFTNSTEYIVKNVYFGPIFSRLFPEQIIFGHFNYYIYAEHLFNVYLQGDDCTVNPWIGFNPQYDYWWEYTFEHLRNSSIMHTGTDHHINIRRYTSFYGSPFIVHTMPKMDVTGDGCYWKTESPYPNEIYLSDATDGYQFEQYPGNAPEGDDNVVMDMNTYRAMKMFKPSHDEYLYKEIQVNPYLLQFDNKIMAEGGVVVENAIDMTNFLQAYSMISKAKYKSVETTEYDMPQVTYKHQLKPAPSGIEPEDSYYEVEPHSGLVLHYEKNMMSSGVVMYDELFDRPSGQTKGLIIPYYTLYESMAVSDSFIEEMKQKVEEYERTQRIVIIVSLSVGGSLLAIGIILFVLTCFLGPESLKTSSDGQAAQPQARAPNITIQGRSFESSLPTSDQDKKPDALLDG